MPLRDAMGERSWLSFSWFAPDRTNSIAVTGVEARRVMRSIFAPISLIPIASSKIAVGFILVDKITTCTRPAFVETADLPSYEKSVAISTSKLVAQLSKSAAIALSCAGLRAIKTVRISRSLMTTCSISTTVMAKAERTSKRDAVMPGLSTPLRRIRPVNCSSSALLVMMRARLS